MPKQSEGQKDTVERVMHEFKHGELESSSGGKVKNRRQAVAIALSEAGASRNQSKAENRKRLAQTKRRERSAQKPGQTSSTRRDGPTHDELYERARKRNIHGRSRMSKAELARAVGA